MLCKKEWNVKRCKFAKLDEFSVHSAPPWPDYKLGSLRYKVSSTWLVHMHTYVGTNMFVILVGVALHEFLNSFSCRTCMHLYIFRYRRRRHYWLTTGRSIWFWWLLGVDCRFDVGHKMFTTWSRNVIILPTNNQAILPLVLFQLS